jgi:hypothetical protein
VPLIVTRMVVLPYATLVIGGKLPLLKDERLLAPDIQGFQARDGQGPRSSPLNIGYSVLSDCPL